MTTQTEALKLALDALRMPCNFWNKVQFVRVNEAIKALEEALAKQEQGEPVEWGVDWGKDGNSVSIIKRLADGSIEVLGWEYAPHPQQRTWVGLTDEDCKGMSAGDKVVAMWANRTLKEKNT